MLLDPMNNAPADLLELHAAMIANAVEAGLTPNAVYTRPANGGWIVGANFEGFGASMLRTPAGDWAYRYGINSFEGYGDDPMRGGYFEALSNARCFFTG